jgi:hypothetical protein
VHSGAVQGEGNSTLSILNKAKRLGVFGLVLVGLAMVSAGVADARRAAQAFAATLDQPERQRFEAWYSAQVFFDASMDAYWDKVEAKRRMRRAKRRRGQAFLHRDYVKNNPPTYTGPQISVSLLRRWRAFRDRDKPKRTVKRRELPAVKDYLAAARRHFGFRPERISELEFKRRYAAEALRLGLTKDQVVRIYALETGGYGTADMQAGVHPISRRGRPISSALGYAQLLAANSINVLAKHGPTFVQRLAAKLEAARDGGRRARLRHKLNVLKRMVRTAKSVPYRWSRHVRFSRTSRGMALHVMNIDGDIGPWMQVVKIADLKRMAAAKGRQRLSGAEIELMNLAGPATGLEMMLATGRDKSTANFFSRGAYYRNSVVRGRDSTGLLVALEERMRANIKNKGAQEFLAVFDQLIAARPRPPRPVLAPRASNEPAPQPFEGPNLSAN